MAMGHFPWERLFPEQATGGRVEADDPVRSSGHPPAGLVDDDAAE
jgi:hypothetical protein